MRITTNILLGFLILVLAFGFYNLKNINLDLNISEHKNNTITVTGKAEKNLVPDTAKISFSVNEYNKKQNIAADKVNKKVKNIIKAIKNLGVEEKDIKTERYSIYPEYDWFDDIRTFKDFKVSQSVEIKVRDLEKLSKIIAKVAELKVDNLSGPNMFIDNLEEIKKEMRAEAIKNAKKEADKLASELGIKLDKIVAFSESGNSKRYYPQIMYKTLAMDSAPMESVEAPEINPGEEKITKSVSITYQIQD